MAGTISEKVASLGLTLPTTAPPAANYVPFMIAGKLVFVSGQIPLLNGERPYTGKVGSKVSIDQAVSAAQLCGLNILAWIARVVEDDIESVVRCVRLGGWVNCVPEFTQHPTVINGASDLMVQVFGDKGRHARAAVGSSSLPFDVSVEVDAIFEIAE
jgi:enamine deaminase RidA (YjgF/YER057c/UK114 family)